MWICCPRARPARAALHHCRWRSAWSRSPPCCWTGCHTGAPPGRSGALKTEVGDSPDLLLGALAALGSCQPDGTFVTTLADLRALLLEMAGAGEVVVVDGLATRVQRSCGWANQKVLYDPTGKC
jgi:hypothetical protein